MSRPLDEISDWENIHGITPNLMNRVLKRTSLYTPFGTYNIQNELFSEEYFVKIMKFREVYLKKIHKLLTERLPPEAVIKVKIFKKYERVSFGSYNLAKANFNKRVTNTKEKGEEALKKAAADYVNPNMLIIYIYIPKDGVNIPYDLQFNIQNPMPIRGFLNRVNTRIGINVPSIVYNAVKELSDDASAKISTQLMEHIYRPPNGNNRGGLGYTRVLGNYNTRASGNYNTRTLRNNNSRKTRRGKK